MKQKASTSNSPSSRLKTYRLPLAVLALYVVAALRSPASAIEAVGFAVSTLAGVLPIIIAVFAAIGLVQVFVDKQKLAHHLGERAGFRALLLAAAVGTILIGPVFVIFPLLKTMRDHGTSWAVVTTTLTAWAVKLPMIPLEAGFLGWEFSLVRSLLTLVAAVLMGSLMGRLMREHEDSAAEQTDMAA